MRAGERAMRAGEESEAGRGKGAMRTEDEAGQAEGARRAWGVGGGGDGPARGRVMRAGEER